MPGEPHDHRPFEDLAVRHVMGSLDAEEASAFRSHLLDCSDCRAKVGELRSIASALAQVERNERRERAARLVEIKERELAEDADAPEMGLGPTRSARLLALVAVAVIVLLSVWNFVLRGQGEGMRNEIVALRESAEVVNFGDEWSATVRGSGVDGVVRVEEGRLAVMVRGTDDLRIYRILIKDDMGEVLRSSEERSVDGQVRYYGPLPSDAERVVVVIPRTTGDTVVFSATEPRARATGDS